MARAVQKLQGLDDEFDLTDSACAELHVPLELIVSDDVALDSALDQGDFFEQIRCRIARENKGLVQAQEIVGQFAIAADPARLDEREPF
ncbi:MAG: hypothetical protein ACREFG_10420, partial [Chthoniobacterales bacterium]